MSEQQRATRVQARVMTVTRSHKSGRASDWEVTDADLNMYALIVGRTPSDAERLEAIAGVADGTTAAAEAAGPAAAAVSRRARASRVPARGGGGWSPSVLCAYLRDFYQAGGVHLRVRRPDVAAWVQNVSLEARKRLLETQARLGAARVK